MTGRLAEIKARQSRGRLSPDDDCWLISEIEGLKKIAVGGYTVSKLQDEIERLKAENEKLKEKTAWQRQGGPIHHLPGAD